MTTTILSFAPILAQVTGDGAIDSLSVTIFKILFIAGVLCIASGAWTMRQGQIEMGVIGILAGMIMALAYPFMSGFYDKAGMSNAKLKLSHQAPAIMRSKNLPLQSNQQQKG